MNLTYYSFSPFAITSGKVTVLDVGVQRIYQDLTLGLQGKAETIHLSDDDFTSIALKTGAQWYGDPLLSVDLNNLFQRKIQSQLLQLLADDQAVKLADGLRELLSQILADSYLMDVPLEIPETPELAKLVKFSNLQLSPELVGDVYGILEALIQDTFRVK